MQRRTLMVWAATSLALAACRKKVYYAPAAELEHGVHVNISDAYRRGDNFYVKTFVTNAGEHPVRINREMWSLRLPNGRVIAADPTHNDEFEVLPGATRDIAVDFEGRDDELEQLAQASLVVGGVKVGTDPTPYVVGEIPMSDQPMGLYAEEPPPVAGQSEPASSEQGEPPPPGGAAAPAPEPAAPGAAQPATEPAKKNAPPPVTPQ